VARRTMVDGLGVALTKDEVRALPKVTIERA
jgi:hypothetical protein